MTDQATNALVAIVLGSVLAVVLLIPVAAVQYRLDGRLGPKDLAILVTAAVYALALWTYTLLPMPAEDTFPCQGTQLRLFGSLGLIRLPDDGPAALLRDPAFLQIALNVLLFVPLGYFVRAVLHRGVVVATALGFGDLAADRVHPAHGRVEPLRLRLPALRRRRPGGQHPGRDRRLPAVAAARTPPATGRRHADPHLARPPAGRLRVRRAVRRDARGRRGTGLPRALLRRPARGTGRPRHPGAAAVGGAVRRRGR